jgi:hypothetical protein
MAALRLCINYLATCLITCMRHLKTDTPSPMYKSRKRKHARAHAHTHHTDKKPNVYCKFYTFSPHFTGALHAEKKRTFRRKAAREKYFIIWLGCKFHCNWIANIVTFCLLFSASLGMYFLPETYETAACK